MTRSPQVTSPVRCIWPAGAALGEGTIWIAHCGGACVTCHAPDSALLARIDLPTRNITNCAFGGPGMNTLFISSARGKLSAADVEEEPLAGALVAVDLDVEGLPAGCFAG